MNDENKNAETSDEQPVEVGNPITNRLMEADRAAQAEEDEKPKGEGQP